MDKSELYSIKDGDTGEVVAAGLQSNFEKLVDNKVDKEEGKSLVSDTEINRLASVKNYDDTEIKQQINTKADKSSVPTKVSQLTNDSNYVNDTQLATKSDKITEISDGNGEVTQEIEPNKYYVFGECTTITITLASKVTGIFNEYLFKFTSGSTATVLNLPETCK